MIKHFCHLFQRVTTSLREPEVDDHQHDDQDDDIDDVVSVQKCQLSIWTDCGRLRAIDLLPRDGLQGDRVCEDIQEESEHCRRHGDVEAIGTQIVRPNLRRVRDKQWRKRDIVKAVINEEHWYHRYSNAWSTAVGERSRQSCYTNITGEHSNSRCQENLPASNAVNQERRGNRPEEVPDL